ncbi:ABC transporter ATP-binding protein [Halarsenatibacter silvermanii]|uniref:Putative ABC transport system ATP-binding protein n=1 Tax=Halarsenatibacter silvermanii TaxID=321763 RepID=A0A1G9LU85_9FIRM|nr:ABC transporter ATP-binding protein [Halarsenatibacter silvermanii]SDL65374.1 putative ABC transport system ATP-binding protein [Halarsenatibacter silvermanii]
MTLVKLISVEKIYRQGKVEVPALRGVDLEITRGEFTTVFGPSGSGKTTLLNLIGALDRVTSGSIIFESQKLENLDKNDLALFRRREIGFIFQSYNLIPVFSARENVEFALRIAGGEKSREKAMKLLEDVGLKGMEERKPSELSGGQKQRVAVARALIKQPGLVLADEPTANLDSETGREVLDMMLDMNETLNTTFLFSTHDPMVMDYARRLLELKDGRVVQDKKRGF